MSARQNREYRGCIAEFLAERHHAIAGLIEFSGSVAFHGDQGRDHRQAELVLLLKAIGWARKIVEQRETVANLRDRLLVGRPLRRPPCGGQPVTDGDVRLACFGEVMREQLRARLRFRRKLLFQNPGKSQMVALTSGLHQGLVSHVLKESVLELVADDLGQVRVKEHLGGDQPVQRAAQLMRGHRGHGGQQVKVERPADHRSHLGDLLGRRHLVEPGHQRVRAGSPARPAGLASRHSRWAAWRPIV